MDHNGNQDHVQHRGLELKVVEFLREPFPVPHTIFVMTEFLFWKLITKHQLPSEHFETKQTISTFTNVKHM